jgi:MoxR-like ATPase
VSQDVDLQILPKLRAGLATVLKGTPEAIELLLVGMLSGGHVLIEDVPGVGKTTLAKALARLLDLRFSRVQFTPDLLPSDILGSQVLNPQDGTLAFREGPIFTQVLLADEINRASPRTQSALLEAMSEAQVTTDGVTIRLPSPFFVLATQNPVEFQGTYPLPEAQLDRFVLRFSLGYPDESEELALLKDRREGDPLEALTPVASQSALLKLVEATRAIHVEDRVARYLRQVVQRTREHEELNLGVSPRGTLIYYRACQARALLLGRDYVSPDDVQALASPVLAHRVVVAERARYAGNSPENLCKVITKEVPVPT